MKKALRTELNKLRKAFDSITYENGMSDGAVRRMFQLEKMLQAEEKAGALSFTNRPLGEKSENGIIAECPVCGEAGEKRESRLLRSTLFVHTLRVAPELKDLIRIGQRYTDSGAGGRLAIGEFHMVSGDGVPVMPNVPRSNGIDIDRGWKSFYNNHIDKKKIAQMTDPDLEATPATRKAKAKAAPVKPAVKEVPEWRRLAAQKAWVKIRERRAAAQLAA